LPAEGARARARGLLPFGLAALVCLVLGGLGGLWAAGLDDEPETEPKPVSFIPPPEVPLDFRLRDQDGRWTTPRDARGKVLLLTFLYTSCRDLCPAQAAEIVDAVGKVGEGVQVYGVSVDPVGDTPERARAWLDRFGLTGGPVKYLVGTREELAPVWRQFGIVPINASDEEAEAAGIRADEFRARPRAPGPPPPYEPPTGRTAPAAAREPNPSGDDLRYRGRARHVNGWDFEHSAYVMVIDKEGRQRVGLPFEQLTSSLLARDVKTLLAEG
jgi:protein SCO1/2